MGKAYSAGSLIALAAMSYGDLVILPRSRFMIHSATLGPYGKENEVEASLKANLTEIRALKKEFYTGFLSDLEMQELDKGRDYYFNAAQSRKRALSRVSYLESVKKKTIKAKKTKESDSEDEKVNF
jgi:ATP-dependent protease ClpP protease subunit